MPAFLAALLLKGGVLLTRVIRLRFQRRRMMKKLQAAFGGLVDSKASESWMFWGTTLAGLLCKFAPGFCEVANGITQSALKVDFSVFLVGALTYVAGRFFGKAAKAGKVDA